MIIGLPIGLINSNTYLVYDEASQEGVIIDPGGNTVPLFAAIDRRQLQIRYILNTHAHFDHIAANAIVKAKFDVPLGLHPDDRELLLEGGGAPMFDLVYIPSPLPDLALIDGLQLSIGALQLRVLHTPGHTPGSICLHIPEDTALLTGDTLFAGSVGRTDLPGGNTRQLTASLRKLRTLSPTTIIYPGHGPSSTFAKEYRSNPWLQRIKP